MSVQPFQMSNQWITCLRTTVRFSYLFRAKTTKDVCSNNFAASSPAAGYQTKFLLEPWLSEQMAHSSFIKNLISVHSAQLFAQNCNTAIGKNHDAIMAKKQPLNNRRQWWTGMESGSVTHGQGSIEKIKKHGGYAHKLQVMSLWKRADFREPARVFMASNGEDPCVLAQRFGSTPVFFPRQKKTKCKCCYTFK